jgi:adenylate cyclase
MHAGELDVAIEHLQRAMRLSPRDRSGAPLTVLGHAYLYNRQFDAAVATLLPAIQEHPGSPGAYRGLAACYAHMGRIEEARHVVKRLLAITPTVMPAFVPNRNPEHRELLFSGLRLAMGESA